MTNHFSDEGIFSIMPLLFKHYFNNGKINRSKLPSYAYRVFQIKKEIILQQT